MARPPDRPPPDRANSNSNVRPLALAVVVTLAPAQHALALDGPDRVWDCAPQGQPGGAGAAGNGTWDCRANPGAIPSQPASLLTGAARKSATESGTGQQAEPAASATATSDPEPAASTDPGSAAGPGRSPAPEPAPETAAVPEASETAAARGPAAVPPPPVLPPQDPPLEVPAVVDVARQDYSGPSPWVLPPRDWATPGADTPKVDLALGPLPRASDRLDDIRLYAEPPWDYCGPRIGQTGLGGLQRPPADTQTPIDATADRADYDRQTEVAKLRGSVEIVQGDQRLEADRCTYDRRTGQVDAEGDIYLEYPGGRLAADTGRYNLTTKTGSMERVRYRLSQNANLRGTAAEAELLPGEITRYRDIVYTTCPPGRSDWSIRASDLELDHVDGMGTARNARLRLADIPVFYTPYLRFPIDDRRRSGILVPTIGNSNNTGVDITIPYYWNIAPNLDATFFPRFMSTRGLMLGTQVRHLTRIQKIELNGEILPHDEKLPDYGARGGAHLEQTAQLGPRWSSAIDASWVSDDQYLQDFGNRLDVTSQRNLERRADLYYAGGAYGVFARVQGFQTVDPTIAPANRPYAQLPHVELNAPTRPLPGGAEYNFQARYDYFDHAAKVHGSRLVLLPAVRLPLRASYGYLIPRARLYYTGYGLADTAPGQASAQTFLIPSLDVDGKLIFDRDTDWFGHGLLQTLEPRLYYVLTPYENQSDTPLFDTTLLTFSYASLFRPNRFTGYDRIGDENRLTVGLTSRTIGDESGREWLRFSLGQVYFFDPRRVQLTAETVDESSTSAVAGELSTNPIHGLTARASFQWDPNLSQDQWEQRVLQLRYAPDKERVVNFAYRYSLGQTEPERYENTDFSFRLPLSPKVGLVGRWLYSLLDSDTVDAYAGIEFGRCCWRLRILGRQLKTSADSEPNASIMLQLELAGLGAVGNQIDKLLEQGIDGYELD
jgi:LPS-assembly protein